MKDEYLSLQKRSMATLKKCINKIHHKQLKSVVETVVEPKEEKGESGQHLFNFSLLKLGGTWR